jgi:DNA polymerase-3 subunit beta
MRIKCNKRVLYESLQNVARCVSGRSTLPILSNLLLEARKGNLRIVATDLEIGMESEIPAEVEEEGAITVPAKMLSEVVGSLPEGTIEFSTDDHQTMLLSCGRSRYNLRGLPAEEYPALPRVEKSTSFSLGQAKLKQLIKKAVFAASLDETRAILTGGLLTYDGEKARLAATDTYRLAVNAVEADEKRAKPAQEVSAIVPARALQQLERLLEASEEGAPVQVSLGEAQVVFTLPQLLLQSRLIEGQFPNFEKVIPAESEKKLGAKREDLLQAVRRAAIVARAEANKLVFKVEGGSLQIRAESSDLGDALEELPVELEGAGLEMAFNAEYLIDALGAMESDTVSLELSGPLNPALLKGSEDPGFLCIIMPMQIM